jgi:Ras-related protein Rab-7A
MVESKKGFAKLILLGDVNVGKTTLIGKFTNPKNTGENSKATVGVDFKKRELNINNTDVTIQLWDTAGQEKFESIGYAFYRGVNCCLLIFDLADKASFDNLNKWKKNFLENASPDNPSSFPFVVLGNKSDKDRVVTKEEAEAWCQQNGGLPYFETSATEGTLVEEAFQRAAERGLDNVDDDDLAMPTSLGSAAGAIKIDAADDAKRGTDAAKKRKRCRDKCAIL